METKILKKSNPFDEKNEDIFPPIEQRHDRSPEISL